MLIVSKQKTEASASVFLCLLTRYIQLVPLFWLLHFPEVLDDFFRDGKTRFARCRGLEIVECADF